MSFIPLYVLQVLNKQKLVERFTKNKPENPFQNYDVAKKTLKTNQRILVTQKETL